MAGSRSRLARASASKSTRTWCAASTGWPPGESLRPRAGAVRVVAARPVPRWWSVLARDGDDVDGAQDVLLGQGADLLLVARPECGDEVQVLVVGGRRRHVVHEVQRVQP